MNETFETQLDACPAMKFPANDNMARSQKSGSGSTFFRNRLKCPTDSPGPVSNLCTVPQCEESCTIV